MATIAGRRVHRADIGWHLVEVPARPVATVAVVEPSVNFLEVR